MVYRLAGRAIVPITPRCAPTIPLFGMRSIVISCAPGVSQLRAIHSGADMSFPRSHWSTLCPGKGTAADLALRRSRPRPARVGPQLVPRANQHRAAGVKRSHAGGAHQPKLQDRQPGRRQLQTRRNVGGKHFDKRHGEEGMTSSRANVAAAADSVVQEHGGHSQRTEYRSRPPIWSPTTATAQIICGADDHAAEPKPLETPNLLRRAFVVARALPHRYLSPHLIGDRRWRLLRRIAPDVAGRLHVLDL